MNTNLRLLRKCFQPRQWFVAEGEPDPFPVEEEDAFMWVYRRLADSAFEVGYFLPDKTWFADGVYDTKENATARVHYLNGGTATG